MKVLRPGNGNPGEKPWWVGKTAECNACGCGVELEAGDTDSRAISTHAERHPGGKQWVEGPCPTVGCAGAITATNTEGPRAHGQEFNPPLAKP